MTNKEIIIVKVNDTIDAEAEMMASVDDRRS